MNVHRQTLVVLLVACSHSAGQYDGCKVYRVVPYTKDQLDVLSTMDMSNSYDFWKGVSELGTPADIMVHPEKLSTFHQTMRTYNITPNETIGNVQKLVDEERAESHSRVIKDWARYATVEQIQTWLKSLETRHGSSLVRAMDAGRSYEGRSLQGVKITFPRPANITRRRAVFLEGGLHGREWISPAVVTYMLDRILTDNNPEVRAAVELYDWYVFPMFNPDGYTYSQRYYRLWRKNRQPWTKLSILSAICKGTDLDRNWDYHWRKTNSSSSHPCNDQYAGKAPFSSLETKQMSTFISNVQEDLAVYLSFHSYGQYILLPYGDNNMPGANAVEAFDVATAAAASIQNKYGTKYQLGNYKEIFKYLVSGDSSDWVKYKYNVPIVLTFKLRGTGRHGFMLPAAQILPTCEETFDGLVTIIRETAKLGYQ